MLNVFGSVPYEPYLIAFAQNHILTDMQISMISLCRMCATSLFCVNKRTSLGLCWTPSSPDMY